MQKQIVIGLIVGLVASVGTWVWSSDFFTKAQKIVIIISLIFLPGALVLIILISIYNKITMPSTSGDASSEYSPKKDLSTLNDSLTKVKELHLKGVFTDSEFLEKTSQIEMQIQSLENEKKQRIIESRVKEIEEYKTLFALYSSQIIDKKEFDEKVKKLVEKYSLTIEIPSISNEEKIDAETELPYHSIRTIIYYFILVGIFLLISYLFLITEY